MATLTKNLFWGQGPKDHRLEVIEGEWPDDMAGAVFVVGPDKRRPGGHWFGAQGLIEKIAMTPDPDGRISVEHRLVETPVSKIREHLPWLFKSIEFMELSPLGISNLANTSIQSIDDRMFIGYDAGRPVEIDPVTLEYLTAVGSNGEWFQALPGLLEPLVAVAAHPATDVGEHAMYFVNYTQVNPPGAAAESYLARWDLEGGVQRWRLAGMSEFDSIHDVKVTENHVVFTDLPFVVEPETMRGAPRTRRNQDDTKVWIVAKEDLRRTVAGGTVEVTEVRVPMPTGHIFADHEEVEGKLRLTLQQIPLTDLMVTVSRTSTAHGSGQSIDPNYEGLIALALQPSIVTTVLIDPSSGEVTGKRSAVDDKAVWGGILCTTDTAHPDAVRRLGQVWCAGIGFDPELVPQEWWDLYGDATDGLVAPADLPTEVVPGSLARVDLDLMSVVDLYTYEPGAFPSPPTFVPRVGSEGPEDGYVVVVVHQDGPKEVQVFDASAVGAGPLARAGSPTFNPGLLLHSCWMADRQGPRPSSYRVPLGRDVVGAVAAIPKVLWSMIRLGREMSRAMKAGA